MNTAVLICADDPAIPHRGADVVAIKDLCDSPSQIEDAVDPGRGAVLLLHQAQYDLADVQKAFRSVDVDPLGVQILDVAAGTDEADLATAVVGLQHRALAYPGSRPEHAKPVRRGKVTLRGLFKPPRPVYVAAPMVDDTVCAAVDGCRACVDVCPQDAYKWHQGRIHFNKDICDPCGLCVSTCPTEAISNPTVAPAMLAEQIRAIVRHSDHPVGVRFVCSRSQSLELVPGWHDVAVPCTGMVSGSWLIAALLMGAGSATTVGCSDCGCPLSLDAHSRTAVDFARATLVAAAHDANSVPLDAVAGEIQNPMAGMDLPAAFTRAGNVEVMLALDSLSDEPLSISHRGSSLGAVEIDSEACTLCAQCAQTCPTDAITAHYEGETVGLWFDAALCTNCQQCTIACPEIAQGAIRVTGRVDVEMLAAGRQTLNEGVVLVCESCGNPIAPSSMMDRIGNLLGDGFDDTMSYLTRRCMDCRGLT